MAQRRKQLITLLVVVDLIIAACGLVDLRQRDDSQIRGSNQFWRIVTIADPGNSLAYCLAGRKRIGPAAPL